MTQTGPTGTVDDAAFAVRACSALLGSAYICSGINGSTQLAFRKIESILLDQAEGLDELAGDMREEIRQSAPTGRHGGAAMSKPGRSPATR